MIVGAVVLGGGKIIVKTRGWEYTLRPLMDGSTAVEKWRKIDWPVGTSITIEILSPKYPLRADTMEWAEMAITLAKSSDVPFRRSPSVWWYDSTHFAVSMIGSIGKTYALARLVDELDRCKSRSIGEMVTDRFGKGCLCRNVLPPRAEELLAMLRENVAPIKARDLKPMGKLAWEHERLVDGYACEEGSITISGNPGAEIPFLVEVWAATCQTQKDAEDDDDVYPLYVSGFTINRSPAIVDIADAGRWGKSRRSWLNLGSLDSELDVCLGAFDFAINITSPYIPIVSQNKSPALKSFEVTIIRAVEKAIRLSAVHRKPELVARSKDDDDENDEPKGPKSESLKKQVLDILSAGEVIRETSSDWTLPFNQRSLFYVVRTKVIGLTKGYFGQLVTEFENDILHDEIPGMHRSNRGAFYEPHSELVIPLGTKTVSEYIRSKWRYATVLVCEKEDNVHMFKASGFSERWDCFLLSSSGFTTRALKDLVDYIGSTAGDEPVRVFLIIDADASGSMIYQTLEQATQARGARNIEIICLGLFPWEVISPSEMFPNGLAVETGLKAIRQAKSKKKDKYGRDKKVRHEPVADYIKNRDLENYEYGNPDDEVMLNGASSWEEWLQDNRVELNAMTPAKRIEWVEQKFTDYGVKKVIPPEQIAKEKLDEFVLNKIIRQVEEESLRNQKSGWNNRLRSGSKA